MHNLNQPRLQFSGYSRLSTQLARIILGRRWDDENLVGRESEHHLHKLVAASHDGIGGIADPVDLQEKLPAELIAVLISDEVP